MSGQLQKKDMTVIALQRSAGHFTIWIVALALPCKYIDGFKKSAVKV
jgi:hypothetical protein